MTNPFDTIDQRLSLIESALLDIKNNLSDKKNSSETKENLNIQEAGELLNLSVNTIYWIFQRNRPQFCA